MELTESQKNELRQLYAAKGDVLEVAMVERLIARGIDEGQARIAARQCSNRIWRNSMVSGALAGIVLGTLYTPVVGVTAGSSLAALVGLETLLSSEACSEVRDFDLQRAVQQINAGL